MTDSEAFLAWKRDNRHTRPSHEDAWHAACRFKDGEMEAFKKRVEDVLVRVLGPTLALDLKDLFR